MQVGRVNFNMKSDAGKGDDPRPIKKTVFDANFDAINMQHESKFIEVKNVKVKGKTVKRYIYK